MENKAHHEPIKLSYQYLKQITNDFHEDRILGRGGFGTVYKGVDDNLGDIAVKVLRNVSGLDDKEFHKEFDNLKGLKHPNIVQLVSFCKESEEENLVFKGQEVRAERFRMALCFEYVHNGSLNELISDETRGLTWPARYKIIKGICEGLNYLHEGLEYPMLHFDLKPDNILLDKSMVPKIADFGLSKLFCEEDTYKMTRCIGTCGYLPPEYIKYQIRSREFDIFSLGVIIIKIMAGHESYNSIVEMRTRDSVKLVHENWRKRLHRKLNHRSLEVYCKQVKRCIKIALACLVKNRQERPSINDIVSSLNRIEAISDDQGMQNGQFYQDNGESTLPSDVSSNSINSRPSLEPKVMSLSSLKEMTDDFSETRLLGSDAHGKVYKGVHGNGQVIVVKLFDDKELQNEIAILMKLDHQNIVRFIGYCHEREEMVVPCEEKHVIVENIHTVLCFEYMIGSLEQYLSPGINWQRRYGIIKGMCEGLRYLHEGLERPILHMNLNPENILMDEKMMPKIGGFGYARFIGVGNTHRTMSFMGKRGYMPPEFIEKQVISKEFDIYSLGAIILNLMTEKELYSETGDMIPEEYIKLKCQKWREVLQETVSGMSVEGYYHQVQKCLEIGVKCMERDRHKRPAIGDIIHILNETETSLNFPQLDSELLAVHPLELCFLADMSLEVPINKTAAMMSLSCSLKLDNKRNNRVAFMLVANDPNRYLTKEPLCGVVPPRCSHTLALTMRSNKQPPPSSGSLGTDFFMLYIVPLGEYDLLNVDKDSISAEYGEFFKKVKDKADHEVQEVMLKVICCQQLAGHGTPSEFYQDNGESTLPSDISSITIKSRHPSGHGEGKLACLSTYTENFPVMEPTVMPLSSLKEMTNNFSEALLLGQGLHASVYKGVHWDGQVIAVKMLHHLHGIDDTKFENEIAILTMVQHQNIMQLVGYYNETEERVIQYNGKHVVADERRRMMCFEYLQSGSLEHYISADMNSGLDWQTRYGILKGICKGLEYLHEGLKSPIIHMDLKPSNILMDEAMMPKIGHFGSARLAGVENTHRTMSMMGTIGYMPPEFIEKQVISKEYDIYSLGVITVKLLTGEQSYNEFREIPSQRFIEEAHEKWRRRLQKTVDVTLVDGYCQQVKKCLEIAANCVQIDRHNRPTIGAIVHALNETEILIPHLGIGEVSELDSEDLEILLEVHPLELCFVVATSALLEVAQRKKAILPSSSSLRLNNKGNDSVAFMLVANIPKRYLTKEPLCGIVPPGCSYTLTLTMSNNKKKPSSSSSDNNGVDYFTLYSVAVGEYDLLNVDKDCVTTEYDNFLKKAKEKADHEVQEVNVLCCQQQADLGTSSSEPTRPTVEIITTTNAQQVSSIDVHPTEPWFLTVHHAGSLRVWNCKTMAMLNSIEDATDQPVHVAKFIAREKWLVAGDHSGCIHVYNNGENECIVSFDAHDSSIRTLVVHPVSPFLLSSSEDEDHLIKLWDWGNNWKCTREFGGHTGRVTQIKFNPTNSDSFVSASLDGTIKIWSIGSDDPSNIITLKLDKHALCVDYFTRYNRQHLIVGSKDKTAQIWALGIKGHVDMLEGHEDHITTVKLHTELPLLMTGSLDGTIHIWDSTTYKHKNIIGFNLGGVYDFGCITGSRRIVVGCHKGIATMEIPL